MLRRVGTAAPTARHSGLFMATQAPSGNTLLPARNIAPTQPEIAFFFHASCYVLDPSRVIEIVP